MAAKYLDFKTTLHLINHIIIQSKLVNSDAEQFNLDTFIKSHTLIISLGKDKEIVMRLLEENKFEILHSKNSKLIKYDRFEVTQFDTDEEFICKSIFRKQNNEICNLGLYKSGDNNRIKSISISKMNPV